MPEFKKGTVVISVDDGRKDAYRLFKEILEPLCLKATFNIVTDWVADNEDSWTVSKRELLEMAQSPLVEIAAHGDTHRNTDEDIALCRQKLCEWLGLSGEIGFASPGSGMKIDFVKENGQKLRDMGFLYIRSSDGNFDLCDKKRRIIEKAKQKNLSEYVLFNIQMLSFGYEDMFVNSVVVCFNNTFEQLKQLTDIAVEENACALFMFHSVKKEGEPAYDDEYSFDYSVFKEIANYWSTLQKEGKLNVQTNREAFINGRLQL